MYASATATPVFVSRCGGDPMPCGSRHLRYSSGISGRSTPTVTFVCQSRLLMYRWRKSNGWGSMCGTGCLPAMSCPPRRSRTSAADAVRRFVEAGNVERHGDSGDGTFRRHRVDVSVGIAVELVAIHGRLAHAVAPRYQARVERQHDRSADDRRSPDPDGASTTRARMSRSSSIRSPSFHVRSIEA